MQALQFIKQKISLPDSCVLLLNISAQRSLITLSVSEWDEERTLCGRFLKAQLAVRHPTLVYSQWEMGAEMPFVPMKISPSDFSNIVTLINCIGYSDFNTYQDDRHLY